MRWHRLAVMAGAALLAGCNMVVSDEPMLSRGPDTPVMKPGVWAAADKSGCDYDAGSAVETWPDCASPMIIREDGAFLTHNAESGKWRINDVVLGSDDPTVLQIALPGEIASSSGSPKYLYLALRPIGHDALGRITAIETWQMVCGPVDKDKAAGGEPEDMVTKEPFDGLTMIDSNCHAQSIAALTNAAAQSEGITDKKGGARWVKDAGEVETE